jgi:GTP-binding protein
LTATAGEAVMTHRLKGYEPYKGTIPGRINGSMISMEAGSSTAYSLDKLQDRGVFFVAPGDDLYVGQVIGEHSRDNDLVVNVVKGKKLTNMRASGTDQNSSLAPPRKFSLEEALEYIQKDEYLEVTPESMRMRKIYLDENERKRMANKID